MDLQSLCSSGNYSKVFQFYSRKTEGNITRGEGLSSLQFTHFNRPIHFAAAQGNLEVVRKLVGEFSCDASCVNLDGVTPLHCASHGGHTKVIEYLMLEQDCDPCVVDYRGSTPLHYVACCAVSTESKKSSHDHVIPNSVMWMHANEPNEDNVKSAKFLIQHGCDPFRRNKCWHLPMLPSLMCRCGNTNDLELVVGQGRIPLKQLSYLLKVACRFENTQIVEKLLASAEDFTQGQVFFKESFEAACLSGNLEMVKLFSDSGKYVPNKDFLCSNALKGGKFLFSDEVMKHILKAYGYHPFMEDDDEKLLINSLFPVACRQNYTRVAKVLLVEDCINKDDKIALHLACSHNSVEVVKLLVELSFRQDIKNEDGKLPLHIACEKNSLVLAQLVSSQKDLDLNCEDNAGNTPLHLACQLGNAGLVQFLTRDKHCDQNVLNKKRQLPLHITCKQGNIELTKLVSSEVVDMNTKDMVGNTPLHIACQSGNSKLIQYLTRQKFCGQNIANNKRQLPLHIVCKHGSSKLANLVMFQDNVGVNKQDRDGNTPLHIACSSKESLSLVKCLVLHKQSKMNVVNNEGELPLHLALSTFPQLTVELVEALSRDVDMHTKCKSGSTPLHIACKAANFDAIKYIVSTKDCHPYSHSDYMHYADLQIHCVCKNDKHADILCNLVTGENVTVTDSNGDTPLHVACKNNNLKAAILVFGFRASWRIENRDGEVPFYIACSKSLEIVKLFKTIDASEAQQALHLRYSLKYSPLHNACRHGKVEIVQYLIEEINCSTDSIAKVPQIGDTLLHTACRYGSMEVAKYLIENDYCSIEEKNMNNELPLHLACGCPTPSDDLIKLVGDSKFLSINNKEKLCPLLITCSQGHLNVIKYLTTEVGHNIYTKQNFTDALIFMVKEVERNSTHYEIIKHLITKCKANPKAMSGDESLLETACRVDDLELVKALTIVDVDLYDKKGNTVLHYACQYTCYNIAKDLLGFAGNCNQNIANKQGSLALHIACQNSPNIIGLLNLDNVSIEDEDGNTPLHLACLGKNADTIQQLLQKLPPCKLQVNKEGHSPLHLVCSGSLESAHKLQFVKVLLKHDPTLADSKAVHIACNQRNIDLLEVLVNSSNVNDVDSAGKTPLQVASEQRNYSMVCWLVRHGADCSIDIKDDDENLPLHLCISTSRQSLEAVIALGNNLISVPNKEGNTPVHIACQRFAIDILQFFSRGTMFYKALSHQNNNGSTPLHLIVKQSLSKVVHALFANTDCNTSDNNGNTPLHIACDARHYLNVKCLTEELGCKPNKKNNDGDLPLHRAASHSIDMVKITATSSELTNTCNEAGDTPLHIACQCKQTSIVRYLIKKMNASTSVPNSRKECAIHTVCLLPEQSIELFDSVIKHTPPGVLVHKDIDGNTPLHLACMRGHFYYAIQLVQRFQCPTNIQNGYGETPLHIVCKLHRQFKPTEEVLMTLKNCDPTSQVNENIPDQNKIKPGDTPLHVACRTGEAYIIDSIISSHRKAAQVKNHHLEFPFHVCCHQSRKLVKIITDACTMDYNSQNNDGNTGLHIAAGNVDIAKFLLSKLKCNPNLRNQESELPLHIACMKGNLKTIRLLGQTTLPCLIDECNKLGNTPLHEAAMHEGCVEYLLNIGCKAEVKNKKHEYPIHLACRKGTPSDVAFLFQRCNKDQIISQSMVTKSGNTLLHEACENQFYFVKGIIEYLKTNTSSNIYTSWLSAPNSDGDLPLHVACRGHSLEVVQLLSCPAHNVLCYSNEQDETPLHDIFKRRPDRNFQKVIEYLLEKLKEIDHVEEAVSCKNIKGQTPLHCACAKGNLIGVKVLLDHKCDPNALDGEGNSPIFLTTDHEIIKALLKHGANPEQLYQIHKDVILAPPPTPVKLIFIGHPEVGKTTITQSLLNEACIEAVKSATKGHTAGVIPTNFTSKKYGAVTVYDFAGQPEYYASHDAVLYATITNNPPVVLILFNLLKSDKVIKDQVRYWIAFISNRCANLTSKAHVIIIGSHADEFKGNPVEKIKQLQKSFKQEFLEQPLTLKSVMYMDCRLSQSAEMSNLHKILTESVNDLREEGVMQFSIHCFYVLLISTFKEKTAVHIADILKAIEEAPNDSPFVYLPKDMESLIEMCKELDTKGYIMFIEHFTEGTLDWVILEQVKLLEDVSGSLFAPSNFPQHYPLSYSTGVVPLSRLKAYYDEYDPDMLMTFLTRMEYCQEVLECIASDEETFENNDKYFFFPHLVSLDRPTGKWNEGSDTAYKFGWLLQCRKDGFNPHFIQALLLRLAFGFAMKAGDENDESDSETNGSEFDAFDDYYSDEVDSEESEDDSSQTSNIATEQSLAQKITIKRICSVWKNGIYWQDNNGVTSIVDVIEQRKLLILMQCKTGCEVECIQHRSSVISMVFKTQRDLCPRAKFNEYFLHPDSLKHPVANFNKETLFSIDEIKCAIKTGKQQIVVNRANKAIKLQTLLCFEPYSQRVVFEFCNQANASKQLCKDVLDTITDSLDECYKGNAIVLGMRRCFLGKDSTVKEFIKWIDQCSIFKDRQHPQFQGTIIII